MRSQETQFDFGDQTYSSPFCQRANALLSCNEGRRRARVKDDCVDSIEPRVWEQQLFPECFVTVFSLVTTSVLVMLGGNIFPLLSFLSSVEAS